MQTEKLIATDAPSKEELMAEAKAEATKALESGASFVLITLSPNESGSKIGMIAAVDQRELYEAAVALTTAVGAISIGDAGMSALPADAAQTLALISGIRSLQSYATDAVNAAASVQPTTESKH